MNYLGFFMSIIGVLTAIIPIIRAVPYLYDARIYKYKKRIEIAKNIIDIKSELISKDSLLLATDIINDSLFGIKFHVDASGHKRKTLSNLYESGATRRYINIAATMISGNNGKLHKGKLFKSVILLSLIAESVSLIATTSIFALIILKILNLNFKFSPFLNFDIKFMVFFVCLLIILISLYGFFIINDIIRLDILKKFTEDGFTIDLL